MTRELLKQAFDALEAMKEEFRALDLPYGSKAYALANEVTHDISEYLRDNKDADLYETALRIENGEITNAHFSNRNLVMCSKEHYSALEHEVTHDIYSSLEKSKDQSELYELPNPVHVPSHVWFVSNNTFAAAFWSDEETQKFISGSRLGDGLVASRVSVLDAPSINKFATQKPQPLTRRLLLNIIYKHIEMLNPDHHDDRLLAESIYNVIRLVEVVQYLLQLVVLVL